MKNEEIKEDYLAIQTIETFNRINEALSNLEERFKSLASTT